jgi:pimeloyl-ACP methyl ester carboxylesterase
MSNILKGGKSNWKKIIIISIIFLVLIIGFILFKINFLIGEQLRMTLTPEYSEKTAVSPGNVSFKVDVKLYNKFVCDVSCKYSLIDLSGNRIIDNGTVNSKMYKDTGYTANINLLEYGYGTKLFLYRIECTNIESTLCISNGESLVRKSLMVVTYEPTSEQLAALFSSRQNYALISRNLANSSSIIKNAGSIIGSMNLSLDNGRYYSLKSEYDSLDSQLHKVLSLWDSNNFVSVASYISENDLSAKSSALPAKALAYISYVNDTIAEHNIMLSEFSYVYDSVSNYENLLSYMPDASYNGYSGNNYASDSMRKYASTYVKDWNTVVSTFNNGKYNSTIIYRDISDLRKSTNGLNNILINSSVDKLSDDYPSLYVYSNILCRLYPDNSSGAAGNVSSGASSGSDVKAYLCGNEYALNVSSIPEASFKLENVCDRASVILDHIGVVATSEDDSMELLLLQYKLLLDYESLNGRSAVTASYKNNVSALLISKYNLTGYDSSSAAAILSSYNFNNSLMSTSGTDYMIKHIQAIYALCGSAGNNAAGNSTSSIPSAVKITVKQYSLPEGIYNASEIPIYPITPPEVSNNCCIYGKCQSCSKISSRNPLIMLHGHSFNQANNAYHSIEIFNMFEDAFVQDGLYYPTGMLVYGANSTRGILGRYEIPIVSKPTYYIETYNDLLGLTVSESKTSNIDTYVLRLKESIDYTLAITGKDKVDIVAHSMGGLVVRRYMQVFGTDSLGTVILISTPNDGISSATYNLCKLFGASNECEDMKSDGLFIKKLNDLSNQPDMSKTYLVVGKGCSTDGVDGDGVVTLNNSVIKMISSSHILYVDGNCSGTSLLHNNVMNVYDYPKVYTFVKSKLEQE